MAWYGGGTRRTPPAEHPNTVSAWKVVGVGAEDGESEGTSDDVSFSSFDDPDAVGDPGEAGVPGDGAISPEGVGAGGGFNETGVGAFDSIEGFASGPREIHKAVENSCMKRCDQNASSSRKIPTCSAAFLCFNGLVDVSIRKPLHDCLLTGCWVLRAQLVATSFGDAFGALVPLLHWPQQKALE